MVSITWSVLEFGGMLVPFIFTTLGDGKLPLRSPLTVPPNCDVAIWPLRLLNAGCAYEIRPVLLIPVTNRFPVPELATTLVSIVPLSFLHVQFLLIAPTQQLVVPAAGVAGATWFTNVFTRSGCKAFTSRESLPAATVPTPAPIFSDNAPVESMLRPVLAGMVTPPKFVALAGSRV